MRSGGRPDATGVPYGFVQLANHAGALRCLLGSAEDEPRLEELHDLVDRARERSRVTCPRCGKRGCKGCVAARGS